MTVNERLFNEYKRINTLFRIVNGEGFYVEDGKLYTRTEFEKKYPAPLKIRYEKVENADPSQDWLY